MSADTPSPPIGSQIRFDDPDMTACSIERHLNFGPRLEPLRRGLGQAGGTAIDGPVHPVRGTLHR